jgi:hypothetical protein
MKKLLALFLAAGMVAFMACGGGKKEAAAKAKADSTKKADSIAKINDSIKKIKEADSLKEVAKKDSLKKDSIDKKGGKKEVKKEVKKTK